MKKKIIALLWSFSLMMLASCGSDSENPASQGDNPSGVVDLEDDENLDDEDSDDEDDGSSDDEDFGDDDEDSDDGDENSDDEDSDDGSDKEKSSSSKKSSSSSAEDDEGENSSSSGALIYEDRVRGTCWSNKTSVEKDGSVQWSFKLQTTGMEVESYSWTFTDGSSIETSNEESPEVSYPEKGSFNAKLVVNKGLPTESLEIQCINKVVVKGVGVSGCECTLETPEVDYFTAISPARATWKVAGCTGAAPYTYEWTDATGDGEIASNSYTETGEYAPSVVVTNSDGYTTAVSCPAMESRELLTGSCQFKDDDHGYSSLLSVIPNQDVSFRLFDVANWAYPYEAMEAKLVVGEEITEFRLNYDYEGSSVPVKISAPSANKDYTYTLYVAGKEVCSADLSVEYPAITFDCGFAGPAIVGTNVDLTFSGEPSGWPSALADNVQMRFVGNGTTRNVMISRSDKNDFDVAVPSTPGEYEYELRYGNRLVCSATLTAYEITAECPTLSGNIGETIEDVNFNVSGVRDVSADMILYVDGVNYQSDKCGLYGTCPSMNVELDDAGVHEYKLNVSGVDVCSGTMSVAIPDITADCSFEASRFTLSNIENWNTAYLGLSLTMELTGPGAYSQSVKVRSTGGSLSVPTPTQSGTFTLKYGNQTVCTTEYSAE